MPNNNKYFKDREKAQEMAAAGRSVADIKARTGFGGETVRQIISNWGPSAAASPSDPTNNSQNPYSAGNVPGTSPGMSREEYDYAFQSGLIDLQGGIAKELEALRGSTAIRGAEIAAGATVRSAELDAEARRYLGDKDYLAKTDVAKIQAENNLKLQNIINAGLKDVEGIRQEGGKDIARITGEFGVKQESERQRGQKDIAQLGSESAYRNALISAFSF